MGVPLSATIGNAEHLHGEPSVKWYRGTTAGQYKAEPVATGTEYTPTAADCEHWLKVAADDDEGVFSETSFFFSRLPVVYLSTEDGTAPTAKKEEHAGTVRVQGNEEFPLQYDGGFKIHVRGNTSAGRPKKPYKIKLDKKTDMFGFGKSKHWVLLANYLDESLMRNKLAYDFARGIGVLGMQSTWVDCVLNGTWIGCYQFCEHIRVDSGRVAVYDWEDAAESVAGKFASQFGLSAEEEDALVDRLQQDFSWVTSDSVTFNGNTGRPSALWKKYSGDISGGYLFEMSIEYDELSRFVVTSGVLQVKTMVNTPEYLFSNEEMMSYCQNYWASYWDACQSPDGYCGEGTHYSELADLDSMVGYWLVLEMFGNNDAVYKSRYAYKDQQGKLVFGPVWDFDWGVGSPATAHLATNGATGETYWSFPKPTGWKICMNNLVNNFLKEWVDDPFFCMKALERYREIRPAFAEIVEDGGLIDRYAAFWTKPGRRTRRNGNTGSVFPGRTVTSGTSRTT